MMITKFGADELVKLEFPCGQDGFTDGDSMLESMKSLHGTFLAWCNVHRNPNNMKTAATALRVRS